MRLLSYRGRQAVEIENADLRITVLIQGGHVASIVRRAGSAAGINPLWTPPWDTVEPSDYSVERHPEFGTTQEARVLASIMGHSLCLDTYGGPSPEEAAAGMPVHGEGSLVPYAVESIGPRAIRFSAELPLAHLRFDRTIQLTETGGTAHIHETIENLAASDRPIAWTQHVTLGPPFIDYGQTRFFLTATRSRVIDADFGGVQQPGAEFTWPLCPTRNGGHADLRRFTESGKSGEFSTQLSDPARDHGAFAAWSPQAKLAFGYAWNRNEFPWICRWEENKTRLDAPWNGRTLTCAMEFGVSPTIESRRDMVNRGSLFGVPAFRWVPARSRIEASYCAFLLDAAAVPADVQWQAGSEARIQFE